ncbi:MAG TPA: glycosyltransferase family 2 protein [Solirubrobacterales bacterium]|nr:glycosyltransferase family 2 protein [Solirubrobacterales bacterium]
MRILAAICTNRAPAEVRPALEPAARQAAEIPGASALLVTSGLDDEAHRAHAEAAAVLGARAVAAPTGLSAARNRALEDPGWADVVAYLDDDAVPAPDWLERLAARWAEAPPEVAAIAGRIAARWEAEPPAWVSDRIATSFSLLDLGEGLVELDPANALEGFGANISFRTRPLRAVGGFDSSRGIWGRVSLYGEESLVQRRLAERGHRLLYAGDVRAEHRIAADRLRLRALWRREVGRGATAVLDSRETPTGGAGRALKAGGGTLAALARGDRPLAGERFARLARAAGAAASPLLLRRMRSRGWPG